MYFPNNLLALCDQERDSTSLNLIVGECRFATFRFTCNSGGMKTDNTTSPALMAAGRWLVALYFLVPGIMKFTAFPMHVGLMNLHKVPYPEAMLIIAGIAQIVGAILLITGRFVRFTALGFVVYTALINLLLHDFWNFTGIAAGHEMQNFIKNLGILAGLLVLAGAVPWRTPSIVGIVKSDKRWLQTAR
jgi:putative oxidoreductase